MSILVKANEATAAKRYVYFHLVDATDGMTAETGEAGGQPQISANGAAWTNTEIGVLVVIGNGRYYAELTQTVVAMAGTIIETRYKSANTAECPGDKVQVVGFDPSYDFVGADVNTLKTIKDAIAAIATDWLAETGWSADPTLTLGKGMKLMVSMAMGKYSMSGDTLTVYDLDGLTVIATIAITDSGRTVTVA